MTTSFLTPSRAVGLLVLSCAGFGFWGLHWGLPSQSRADLFLRADQRTPEFFEKVETSRTQWYQKIGESPIAYLGRSATASNADRYTHNILSSYSSFLVRTHDGDEQQTIVMLSRLNPLHEKWYPYSFQYGGAYVYPLALFVGISHALHFIRLVPDVAYYYAHPEKMASVYVAVRVWSLIGSTLSVVALFLICQRHWGTSTAFWAALFYALSPAAVAFAKIAKPHEWAPLWVLLGIHGCLVHREDRRSRTLLLAAIAFGIAIGTTMSQWVYVPLLLWSAWERDLKRFFIKISAGGGIVGAIFLLCNFTLPWHIDDFKYEAIFLSAYYPFRVTWNALKDYFLVLIPCAAGIGTCIVGYVGIIKNGCGRKDRKLAALAVFWMLTSVLIAFQMQATHGTPMSSRLYLSHVALCCLFCAAATSNIKAGTPLRFVCAGLLIVQAIVMCRHFSSDVAPNDNASRAGAWIQTNVPRGSRIGLNSPVPHVDLFPPIPFENYTLVMPEDAAAHPAPEYYVLHGEDEPGHEMMKANGYTLKQHFATSPVQRWGFQDHFTNANFVVDIYSKN